MTATNSLSSLLRTYMSESENENEENQTNSFSQEIGNLLNEIGDNFQEQESLPTTDWAQCMDVNTGHPYYWNIATKEVTWEKPAQYENFLKDVKRILKKIPDDSWTLGYTEDSQTPYYLNKFTREISWHKPAGFKSKKKKSKKPQKRKQKQVEEPDTSNHTPDTPNHTPDTPNHTKKKYPKHLEQGSDEDVKIELINSFSNKSASSSDDDEKNKSNVNKEKLVQTDKNKQTQLHLVAAYATDDEEESEAEKIINKDNQNICKISSGSPEETQTSEKSNPISDKLQVTSFASIITGGKIECEFDDEISKLKEELEKDLANKELEEDAIIKENSIETKKSLIDVNFDEKNFKRKRRIEFGTTGKGSQTPEGAENSDSRPSFALNPDILKENSNPDQIVQKKNIYSNFTRSHVEFLKTDEVTNEKRDKNEEEKKNIKLKYDKEIEDLSDIIIGKVKFLSVGHTKVSTVQAMHIQLETLLAAFKSASLSSEYFFKWLKQTSDDLMKLEETAAPDGWKCQWDRTTGQYCYENLKTKEIRWEFPSTKETNDDENCDENIKDESDKEIENIMKEKENVTEEKKPNDDNINGEVEMDISTTPPPNQNEKIIVQHAWDADNAPPPPRISSPSSSTKSNSLIINDELTAFYSDIAKISSEIPEQNDSSPSNKDSDKTETGSNSPLTLSVEKIEQQNQNTIEKRKRKKPKVTGLSMGDKGVTEMVAKWQKAQQQKGYNFW